MPLILLQKKANFDFEMVYFNADGKESSMCGNGGRCIAAFANRLGIIKKTARFHAMDGEHFATIENDIVTLQMQNVTGIEGKRNHFVLNTGSPHYVRFVNEIGAMDVVNEGRKVRNAPNFKQFGINVNFVERRGKGIFVRTYERGVENETLSCGTGVTAAAIVTALQGYSHHEHCDVETLGGHLKVYFHRHNHSSYSNVLLQGPATFVFEGKL